MSSFLKEELAKRGIDDEAIVEYCVGLLDDDTMDGDEKQEAIAGYLEAATDEDLGDVIKKALEMSDDERAKREVADQAKAKEALDRALIKEKEELERDAKETREVVSSTVRQMTAEERKQRERFLMTYGFDVDEIVEGQNGEDEIVYKGRDEGKADLGVERNTNAQVAAEKDRALRESSRAAHQKKLEREKELVEKEKLRKEKEKRRTMKKEKRRM
ncbi:hypothetical protein GQ54DRAFT_324586 [Martensiomyces pterosporus]|nr:hypothetical protein GQ54DRAFT_324586 [Martensiomyces pterosporus]